MSLDTLVTNVAAKLMAATSATSAQVSQDVLADLVASFGVDFSFLRYNDHSIRATVLVAEWPPRPDVPDPDPLGVVYFDGADPIFAAAENAKEPVFFSPEPAPDDAEDYQRRVQEASGVTLPSLASVPLLSGEITTGCLGFIKIGIKDWTPEETNALKAIASLFAQVQARVVAEDQLRYLAEHDDLTGLYNRRALLAHIDERLRPEEAGPVSVLFLDLDRLKAINDYLGHHAGDWFIQAFAERLREETGDGDVIARLGGDEFVIVPAGSVDADAAEALAHRLQDALRDRVTIGGETLTRTVSAGVALGVPGRDTTSDLLRRADQAVLNAKNAGGNKIAVFTDEMSLRSEFRNDIELHLQNVIDTGSLILHYLPEVDMRTGEILATEALVRWQHPTRGLLLPDSFIHVAESINLAGELGRWVMRTACEEFSRWQASGIAEDAVIRINVSPVQLVADGFVQSVAETIAEFGLDGKSVCLEITESVVVQDIETTRITLAGLKEVGVRIAIDDFGTGYSVLTHLKSLPVDTLKIDKGFVLELGTNPEDLAIVRAIIALAEAFNLELVAEGVESPTAAMTLLQHGCHRAQGFLLSRPIPSDAMAELFAKRVIPVDFSVPIRT
ncbi:putative bifunctional diguanylate cyclase/phosphodiesterase [Mycolicibacterium aichiense]|uniref:Bifunctional diguanylate cyclase/phosphodiesterase n=1 Tax=Mycolicibacterium aichiense TaxID=1799 RepID=A0AAD1HR95_9MYCO|nr:EAL domain-containing protein [Mycolicibacterium aichiense]MCV7017282.1 EAL domain-containing protein [Mycolicibacterium aichiense]BBX10287.1 bifunctional diguanylate cyclase/phosphodiesterase [Mycolicibacterium aichiense]STZ26053.1 diguanylate cyclase (GGDEF) domain-containing protein [Mycolicibacterium aichiense]